MGYIDFNGIRYFDHRELSNICSPYKDVDNPLPSHSTRRQDAITLSTGDVDKAQELKEELEALQRHDRKLREEAEQRRAKGGRKYKNIF